MTEKLYCSFCGKESGEVKKLIAGPTVFICNECVVVCVEVLVDAKVLIVVAKDADVPPEPIPMRLNCPECGDLHVDEGEFATKPHHTHACQGCGNVWRPAVVPTLGVKFLPGFKNGAKA